MKERGFNSLDATGITFHKELIKNPVPVNPKQD
jgi:hypothetical protein